MIKKIIINKIKSNCSLTKRTEGSISLQETRKIVLTLEIADYPFILDLVKRLEAEGKTCRLIVFSEAKENVFPEIKGFIFSKKNLDFWSIPSVEIVKKFSEEVKDTDILIDLSIHNYLPLSYLISSFSAKLKVGIKKEGFDLYDFMLDAPKNIDLRFLSEQIMFYLRKLKS